MLDGLTPIIERATISEIYIHLVEQAICNVCNKMYPNCNCEYIHKYPEPNILTIK